MPATVSYYPQVSEWLYLGDVAINLAQVASIEFEHTGDGEAAIVRLASYRIADEFDDSGKTWFRVSGAELVQSLRQYVEALRAPGFAQDRPSGGR